MKKKISVTDFPNEPRYKTINYLAMQILNSLEKATVPTSLFDIIKLNDNLKIYSYNEVRLELPQFKEALEISDTGLLYRDKNDYYIFYNTDNQSIQRIRFTVAHELGHYYLKHYDLIDNNTPYIDTKILEIEANYFAKLILFPKHIYYYLTKNFELKCNVTNLKYMFMVSRDVIKNSMQNYYKINKKQLKTINANLDNYKEYINGIKNKKFL